jgi:hypothetical protein
MKIRPVGAAELFHGEGQTDRHDGANNRFSQFCERAYKHTVVTPLPHPSYILIALNGCQTYLRTI